MKQTDQMDVIIKLLQAAWMFFLSLLLTSFISIAQQPFDCNGKLYFFQDGGGTFTTPRPNYISTISGYTTGSIVVDTICSVDKPHNALGANPADMMLYYLSTAGLVRIDAACNKTVVCPGIPLVLAGAFDYRGLYWTLSGNDIVVYNVSTCNIVMGPFAGLGTGIIDISFNVLDCHLYLSNGDIVTKIDTNGTVVNTFVARFGPDTYGGIAIGEDGNLYGIGGAGASGILSVINLTTQQTTTVGTIIPGPALAQSDMASFPCNDIMADFDVIVDSCPFPVVISLNDLSTGSPTSWYWDFGDGSTDTVQNPVHTYKGSGTYIVKLIVAKYFSPCAANPKDTMEKQIVIPACGLTVVAMSDSICQGVCTDIEATVTDGTPPYTYNWSQNLGTGAGPYNVCPTATTTYSVTITDQNGDTASATTTVTVFNPPVPTTSHQDATCGQCDGTVSVTATGSSPFTYNWSSGCTTASCTAMCPGTYSVTVTDKNGCTATASEPVNNLGAPSITAGSTDLSCNGACDGTATVTLAVQGTPPYNYLWSNGCTATTCTSLCAGPYTVTITDFNNCQAIANTAVNEPPPLAVTPSATDEVCGNCEGTASASPSGGISGYTYLWGNGEITQSLSGLCAGSYPVTITDATGCVSTSSTTVANQLILPRADFISNPIEVTIFNPTVNFTDKSTGAVSWYWTFGDGDSSVTRHPTHTYQDTGCYPVTLHVVNQYGCEDDINGVVCVKDVSSIYIPNAFTPNGDGTNDWFTVKEYNYCEFQMYIFDRWGNLIYETTSLKGWDGTANGNSEIAQEDVYVWLVKATDCYGEVWQRTGHVTVVK